MAEGHAMVRSARGIEPERRIPPRCVSTAASPLLSLWLPGRHAAPGRVAANHLLLRALPALNERDR